MARKQWWAASVHIFDGDLGIDLRERFGPAGLCMWVGFLAACKRSINPGKITYSSEGECLSLMGLPGLELVNEDGEPFTLDDFWTFLGQRKQTSRTTRRRLVYVTATRWEQWQNDGKRESEAERKRRSRATSGRTEPGHEPDGTRTDRDSDSDTDRESDSSSADDAAAELLDMAIGVLVDLTIEAKPATTNPHGYEHALRKGKREDHEAKALELIAEHGVDTSPVTLAAWLEPHLFTKATASKPLRLACATCNDTTWLDAEVKADGTWGAPAPCPDCNEAASA